MKKSIVAASISLALGASTSASAAFFAADATYRVDVSGGCFAFGDCTALAQNVGTGSFTLATDGTGAAFSVGSYSGIAFTATPGGLFETGGTVAGLGAVSDAGQLDLNFTGRTGTAQYFPQYAGAAWNIDNCTAAGCTSTTGVYEGFTTGADSNIDPITGATSITLTGTNLAPIVAGTTTGVLVSVGNVGAAWTAFDGTPYTEVYNVTVTATEGVPLAADDTVVTVQATSVIINVANDLLINDTHPVNTATPLTFQSFTQPVDALSSVVDNGNGTLTYTPNPAISGLGADSFTYTIDDTGIDGTVDTDTATVIINITPAGNTAPVANDDTVATDEDTAVTFDPVAGSGATTGVVDDTDVDTGTASLVIVSTDLASANNGTVSFVNNDVTYTPPADFNGPDTFVYTIQDPVGAQDTATVTVNVAPVNDKPVCSDVSFTTAIDAPLDITEEELLSTTSTPPLCTDIDGDTLSIATFDSTGTSGGVISSDGATPETLTYTPPAGFEGTDTFAFTATDGTVNADPNTATVNVADPTLSNFTMLDKQGNTFGGTNDVEFEWNGTLQYG